jgi:hypothetical protein
MLKKEISWIYGGKGNVFISDDVSMIYGSSSSSVLQVKAMSWFLSQTSGWDYFISLTGTDYPLIPLKSIETILQSQNPPMPFLLVGTPKTSMHMFRLKKSHPEFHTNVAVRTSISALTVDKGKVLGTKTLEQKAALFGPLLTCNGQSSYYRLDNRRNKTVDGFDTQWLIAKYPQNNRMMTPIPAFDGAIRNWAKSDPSTTGIYDKETVDYIVNSEEGKKYYHFFKSTIMGTELHYFAILLLNWSRTQNFVQLLNAQSVWNTWALGSEEEGKSNGFHSYQPPNMLSTQEFKILQGLSKRGVMFGGRFHSVKTKSLLDMIDRRLLVNATDAGSLWPGLYPVDLEMAGPQFKAMIAAKFGVNRTISEGRGKRKGGRKRKSDRAGDD